MNRNKPLRKKDTVEAIAATGIDKDLVAAVYDAFIVEVIKSLLSGNSIILQNVGTISPNFKEGRSMQVAGEEKNVDATINVSFKTSQSLVDAYRSTLDPHRKESNVKALGRIFERLK